MELKNKLQVSNPALGGVLKHGRGLALGSSLGRFTGPRDSAEFLLNNRRMETWGSGMWVRKLG